MLIGTLALTIGAAVVAIAAVRNRRNVDSAANTWHASVKQLGLKFHRAEQEWRLWRGRVDATLVDAQIDLTTQGGGFPARLTVGADMAIPRSLEVYSDSMLRALGRGLEGRDESLGDSSFDDVARLPTLDAEACAALSHGARSQLALLLDRGGQVKAGRVSLDLLWNTQCDGQALAQYVRWLCRLGRLLSVPRESLHERLAQNAVRDPAPAVRLQNLRFLATPETRTPPALVANTARALLRDVSAPLRLFAARQLGAEGLPALSTLLVAGSPAELVCNVLDSLQPQHASALLEGVLRCTGSEQESVRLAATRLLGKWALPEAEPVLLTLLADSSPYVQLASAQALGTFASVAAVEHLLPLAQALLDSQLRQAARGAIGSIQSRLGDVEAGRVSLADAHQLEGALALADDAAVRIGELSLSVDEIAEGPGPLDVQARAPLKS
ncbi:MAG: hypothetical protein RL685_3104 [Pseudomonadota bacterium]